jgi:hypothetical protein
MESDTSPHVLRFTGFDHRRERRRLEQASPTLRCGDGERSPEVSGSDVSEAEGVCEAPTFMEWSTMVVPTYPEGGSHALQVCQHHHRVASRPLCRVVRRLEEHGARDCSGRFG